MPRIYIVKSDDITTPSLVRANTKAQAIHHVVRNRYTADVASQDDLVAQMQAGTKVEDAATDTGSTAL